MRKALMIVLFALVLRVGGLSRGNAFSQPSEESEEMMQQGRLLETIIQGGTSPRFIQHLDLDEAGITFKQMGDLSDSIGKTLMLLDEEYGIREKIGRVTSDMSRDQLSNLAEFTAAFLPKVNDATRKVMNETLPAETVNRLDVLAFHKFGGTFGGALNVDNLAPLGLTDEQREKAVQIVEKLNRERYELFFSIQIGRKPGEEVDEELLKETIEKMISITRRGQREIEALLTVEQKKLADELMAEVPEKYRFLSEYLNNRPWRLDESNWKPGDGPPPNLENYPGEMRPERTPKDRPFPE